MPTVELYDSLSIQVQFLSVLEDRCSGDVARHFILKLPIAADLLLLGPELLYVLFNLFAEKNFLHADQRSILERQFFVLE